MKINVRNSWNLLNPFVSGSINLLILPFTLKYFSPNDFIDISINAMLVAGISSLIPIGNNPRLLFSARNGVQLNFRTIYFIAFKITIVWCFILLITLTFNLDFLSNQLSLNKFVLICTFIESIIMGITNGIIIVVLLSNSEYIKLSLISLFLVILLGPIRLFAVALGHDRVEDWVTMGILSRLIILFFAVVLVRNTNKMQSITGNNTIANFKIFGKWNLYFFYTLLFWFICNFDRLMIPSKISSTSGVNYQISYQLSTVITLFGIQSIYIATNDIINSRIEIRLKSISSLVMRIEIFFFSLLPILIILFYILRNDINSTDINIFILIAIAQLLAIFIQIQSLYISSFLNMSHKLLIPAIIAAASQISFITLFSGTFNSYYLVIICLVGYVCVIFLQGLMSAELNKIVLTNLIKNKKFIFPLFIIMFCGTNDYLFASLSAKIILIISGTILFWITNFPEIKSEFKNFFLITR